MNAKWLFGLALLSLVLLAGCPQDGPSGNPEERGTIKVGEGAGGGESTTDETEGGE